MDNKKTSAFFVISRYKEDFSWIHEYTEDYLVFNKGDPIENDSRVLNLENIGNNNRDISHFIFLYYEKLPDLIAFVQAYPFDHCKKEVFDILIQNEKFTPLEYYGSMPQNNWERRSYDGGFMEVNNSWYITQYGISHKLYSKYATFDEFMFKYFDNYTPLEFIRFAPGGQYIIKKEQALYYPKSFWESLMLELNGLNPPEGCFVERALWIIFMHQFNLRRRFYE